MSRSFVGQTLHEWKCIADTSAGQLVLHDDETSLMMPLEFISFAVSKRQYCAVFCCIALYCALKCSAAARELILATPRD